MTLRSRAILSVFITISLIGLALLVWAYQKGKITIFGSTEGISIVIKKITATEGDSNNWDNQKDASTNSNNFILNDPVNGLKLNSVSSGGTTTLKWTNLTNTAGNPPISTEAAGLFDIAFDTFSKNQVLFYGQVAGSTRQCDGKEFANEETWSFNLANNQWSKLGAISPCPLNLKTYYQQTQHSGEINSYWDHAGNLQFSGDANASKFTMYTPSVGIWDFINSQWVQRKDAYGNLLGNSDIREIWSRAYLGIRCNSGDPCYRNPQMNIQVDTFSGSQGGMVAKKETKYVYFGGSYFSQTGTGLIGGKPTGTYTYSNDTWVYDTATNNWIQVKKPDGNDFADNGIAKPAKRAFGRIVYNEKLDLFILFGGYDGSKHLDDTWTLKLTYSDGNPTGVWARILGPQTKDNTAISPDKRSSFGFAYINDGKTLLYGGHNDDTSPHKYLTDTWLLEPANTTGTYITKPVRADGPLTKITLTNLVLPAHSSITITPKYVQSNQESVDAVSSLQGSTVQTPAPITISNTTDQETNEPLKDLTPTGGNGPGEYKYVYYYLEITMQTGDNNKSPSIKEMTIEAKPVVGNVTNLKGMVNCDSSQTPQSLTLSWDKVADANGYQYSTSSAFDSPVDAGDSLSANISGLTAGSAYKYYTRAYKRVADINNNPYTIYSGLSDVEVIYDSTHCSTTQTPTPGASETPSGPYVVTIGNFNPVTGEQYTYNSTVTIKSNVNQSGVIDSFGFYDNNNNLLENNPAFRFTYDSPSGKSISANGTLSFNLKIARSDGLEGTYPIIFKTTISGTEYASATKNLVVTKVTPTPSPSPSPSTTSSGQVSGTPSPSQSATPNSIGLFNGVVISDINAFAPSCSQIKLTWSAVNNSYVKGYNIYSAKNDAYLASTSDTQYTFSALTANATYSFYARAHDGTSSGLSAKSSIASVTTPSCNIQQVYSPATTSGTGTSTTGTSGTAGSVAKLISTGGALWFNILIALLFGGVVSWLMLRKK
ncbi:MAG: fibronectin type III domain-containing protein [Patescibacteria group bacterium]|nr:fibronectin type III domain-containing protein [Patescibacteria group bacterium]